MLYLTGIQALNIEDNTECNGDWHTSSQDWGNLLLADSSKSIFGDWGIESDKNLPTHKDKFNVANTLRAILDLMQDKNQLGWLKGFRNDFIGTDTYNEELFEKVVMLKDLPHWSDIDKLMKREFMWEWDGFTKRGVNNE